MKILVAPDKFKGSLTTFEVCDAISEGIQSTMPNAEVLQFPMADGGDGFASVMKHFLQTKTIVADTVDPLGRPLRASYEWHENQKTAIIELAAASGLELLLPAERNPLHTSTYGTGLQVAHAVSLGAEKIVLGLGGSATNDAGLGILAALGFEFLDAANHALEPCGKNLVHIVEIVPPATLPLVIFELACDVSNPLHGPHGAAAVYAPQKGATPEMVFLLDAGLKNIEAVIEKQCGRKMGNVPGTGAAGGIAAGLLPWLAVNMLAGIDLIVAVSGIKHALPAVDLIITGEGKLDMQSLQGKVVGCLAKMGAENGIPVAALCGTLALPENTLQEMGIYYAGAILKEGMALQYCMTHAAELVAQEAATLMHTLPGYMRKS